MSIKVLGFDSWTQGSIHFERLIDSFETSDIDLQLLHLGAWGDDPGHPEQEVIGSLSVTNISFYKGMSFSDILQKEAPDVVIFLSTRSFAHRAFLRICKMKHIPTINLYHGLVRVQAVDGSGLAYKLNKFSYAKYVIERSRKFIKFTLKCSVTALIESRAGTDEWKRLGKDLRDALLGRINRIAPADARATVACVYTPADIQHATRTYGLSKTSVRVVGNPDMIKFGITDSLIGSLVSANSNQRTDIMYIDTGLVAHGLFYRDFADYLDHLVKTKEQVEKYGFRFSVKPHPALLTKSNINHFALRDLNLVSDNEFGTRLSDCQACIVETTTLAMAPALLGMPIFLAQYGRLNGYSFGEVLTSYPRSIPLKNLAELELLLEGEKSRVDIADVLTWIESNAGPLPSSDMPSRVALVVKSFNRQKTENQY